jgi:hypothetical protein
MDLISFKNAAEFFAYQEGRVQTCLDMVKKFGGEGDCFDWTKIEPIKRMAETIFNGSTNGVKTFFTTRHTPTHDATADNINLRLTPIEVHNLPDGSVLSTDIDLTLSNLEIHSVNYNTGRTAITNCYGLSSKPTCFTAIKDNPDHVKTIYEYVNDFFFNDGSTLGIYKLKQESSGLWRETLSQPRLTSTTLVAREDPKLFPEYFDTFVSGENSKHPFHRLSASDMARMTVKVAKDAIVEIGGAVILTGVVIGAFHAINKYVIPYLLVTASSNQLTDSSTETRLRLRS